MDQIKHITLILFVLNQFLILNQMRLNRIKPVQANKYLLNRKIIRSKKTATYVGNIESYRDTIMFWKARLIQGRLDEHRLNNGCYSCEKLGHTHQFCYERINNIKKAWSENKCYVEPKSYCKVWIAKSHLYS